MSSNAPPPKKRQISKIYLNSRALDDKRRSVHIDQVKPKQKKKGRKLAVHKEQGHLLICLFRERLHTNSKIKRVDEGKDEATNL